MGLSGARLAGEALPHDHPKAVRVRRGRELRVLQQLRRHVGHRLQRSQPVVSLSMARLCKDTALHLWM